MGRIIILPEELQIIVNQLEELKLSLKKEHFETEDPILGSEDVLRLLKISRRSLQTWRDEGLIEFSAIKGKFYYRLSAINKMLNDHIQKTGGDSYGKH